MESLWYSIPDNRRLTCTESALKFYNNAYGTDFTLTNFPRNFVQIDDLNVGRSYIGSIGDFGSPNGHRFFIFFDFLRDTWVIMNTCYDNPNIKISAVRLNQLQNLTSGNVEEFFGWRNLHMQFEPREEFIKFYNHNNGA